LLALDFYAMALSERRNRPLTAQHRKRPVDHLNQSLGWCDKRKSQE